MSSQKKTGGLTTVMYIGHSTNHFICESCGRKVIRGFIVEENNVKACSKNCLEVINGN